MMGFPIRTVTPAQCRVVAQPIRYRAGKPTEYRCPSCGDWHPHDAPKLYDRASGTYHGAACDGPVLRRYARQRRAEVRHGLRAQHDANKEGSR